MNYLLLLPFLLLSASSSSLDDDGLLQLLEVEITRTLRSELTSDDELQNLEASGEDPDAYFKKSDSPPDTTTTTTTTTTTVAPTTTTTTPKPTTPRPLQCVNNRECFKDSECPAGKCLGSELGVCDCNACVTNRKCTSDVECGGLWNSCDSTGYCDCVKAFHSHGFHLFIKVLLTFCHQTQCSTTSDNCYGLPCRVGKCKCAPASRSSLPVHYFKPGGK
uniref:Dickkopf_N domain-containing protein n=1 Tax=Caenorhabditis tropicalis TaxID=1561998 RepID=A0A1I7V4D5_9PELO